MGKKSFEEFKKQASFFLREKIKTARLALTDVTPAQLLTEEATKGNPWPPDSRSMGVIARAAFEIDDFYRVADVLHKRLQKFKARDWRVCYNAVILLEHLLMHGPQSFAVEFQDEKDILKQMDTFQFVDDKGFNWGCRVKMVSGRVVKLLDDKTFLKAEKNKARILSRGIQGFGNFSQRYFPTTNSYSSSYQRCNSQCTNSECKRDGNTRAEDDYHPFSEFKHNTTQSLLSYVE